MAPATAPQTFSAEESAEETDFSYPLGMRMATTTKVAVWVFLKQLKKKGQKELGTFRSTTHKRNLQIV